MLVDEDLGQPLNRLGFARGQTAWTHDRIDRLDRLRKIFFGHLAQCLGDHLEAPLAAVGGGGVAVQGNNFQIIIIFRKIIIRSEACQEL